MTPPLDGMILPGVTRDSVLNIARDHIAGKYKIADLPNKLVVSERQVTMREVKEAAQSGNLVEFFGTGPSFAVLEGPLYCSYSHSSRYCCCHQPCEQNRLPRRGHPNSYGP